jgi:phosphoesterase RecJ-like protein
MAQLRSLLSQPRRVAIVAHYNPDGDAMGSSLGLAHVLRATGHTVQVVMPNMPAGNMQWFPGYAELLTHERDGDRAARALRECEVLFCMDFNQTDRVGKLEEALLAAPTRVLIDHHQQPGNFCELMFSDTKAPATCQMVYDIIMALGLDAHIGKEAATCLYAGIVTDTGSFRFRSTTAHTMRVAADLIERGVVVDAVHNAIADDNSEHRLRLLGFTLNERLAVYPDMGLAVIALSRDDLKRFHFQPGDTEGFVNYGLSIRGIRMSALFLERDDMVKLSLRSKGTLAVDQLVKEHFNGGGHINAAGGQSNEKLHEAVTRFMQVVPDYLETENA